MILVLCLCIATGTIQSEGRFQRLLSYFLTPKIDYLLPKFLQRQITTLIIVKYAAIQMFCAKKSKVAAIHVPQTPENTIYIHV